MTERTTGPTGRQIQVSVTSATDEDLQRLAPTDVDVPQFLATAITEHGLVVKLDPALTRQIKTTAGDQSSLMDAGCIGPYPPGSQRC